MVMVKSTLVTQMTMVTAFQTSVISTALADLTVIKMARMTSCQEDGDEDEIDACDSDDDGDGIPDECDVDTTGGSDCDQDGEDDSCRQ